MWINTVHRTKILSMLTIVAYAHFDRQLAAVAYLQLFSIIKFTCLQLWVYGTQYIFKAVCLTVLLTYVLDVCRYKNLAGSDYSRSQIELCKQIASKRNVSGVNFILDDLLSSQMDQQVDVITDKGTLDAIGLMEQPIEQRAKYQKAVSRLLKSSGLLFITQCNSTKDELLEEFTGQQNDGLQWVYVEQVRNYPKFRFGGQEGTKVCTVAFKKL